MGHVGESARVEVYRNLNFGCFSVRALGGKHKGLVIDHVVQITLRNAKFVVQPAGNRRVKAEKRKNVHAFVRGEKSGGGQITNPLTIAYDPYQNDSFVITGPEGHPRVGETIKEAPYVRMIFTLEGNSLIQIQDKIESTAILCHSEPTTIVKHQWKTYVDQGLVVDE